MIARDLIGLLHVRVVTPETLDGIEHADLLEILSIVVEASSLSNLTTQLLHNAEKKHTNQRTTRKIKDSEHTRCVAVQLV